jgi:hypothetical protein
MGSDPDAPPTPVPPEPEGHSHYLDHLVNVQITDPFNRNALRYDGPSGYWVNDAVIGGEAWPTGLIDGGELNIGPGANDIEVIAGQGVIIDSYTDPLAAPTFVFLDWPQINEPISTPAVAGALVWLTIYDTGVPGPTVNGFPTNIGGLRQYTTRPTQPTFRDEIQIGIALFNGDTWGEVSSPAVINNTAHTVEEFFNTVAGPTFVIDGGGVSEAAGFTIDQDAGTVWEMNRNWHVDKKNPHREGLPQTTGLQWRYVNRDFSDVSGLTGVVDPTMWDDGGIVSAVGGPANSATVQQLYQDPRDNYWVLWGQTVFTNATEAAASITTRTDIPLVLQNSVLLAYIVVERAQIDWDLDEAFLVYPEGLGGSGGGGVPITTFTQLADTPANYTTFKRAITKVDDTELFLEFDYRAKFLDYVNGNTYYPQETVYQDGWLSVANTETADYPAPIAAGSPFYAYAGAAPTAAARQRGCRSTGCIPFQATAMPFM